jgi:hypothetical protein
MPKAVAMLAQELLEQEASGDRARTQSWFEKYGKMPPGLASVLERASDVPVDLDPVFDFPEL